MNLPSVVAILKKELPKLRKLHHVSRIALFGSYARGEQRRGSDIDLLVEFDRPVGYFHFLDVKEYLEGVLGGAKVDLVVRGAVFDELKEDIYAEAVNVL